MRDQREQPDKQKIEVGIIGGRFDKVRPRTDSREHECEGICGSPGTEDRRIGRKQDQRRPDPACLVLGALFPLDAS